MASVHTLAMSTRPSTSGLADSVSCNSSACARLFRGVCHGPSFTRSRPASSRFTTIRCLASPQNRISVASIHALDPDFYHIPYVEGIPVGKRLKLWNLPPNCKHSELLEWFAGVDVVVESLELTDDPVLKAQGIGGFVEFATKQHACIAVVRLDGYKFRGHYIRMDFAEKRPRRRDYGDRRRKPGQYKNNDSGFANSSTQHNNKSVSAIERGSRYVSATAGHSQESSLQTDMISSSKGMGYKSSSSRSDVVPHASPSTVFSSDHGATSFSPAFNLANPSYVREDEPSVAKQCYSLDSDASQNLSASNQGTYSSTNDISHRDPKMDHNSNMASRSNRNRDDVRSKVVLRNHESFQQASTNNDIDRMPEGPAYSEDTMLSFVNDCSELSLSVSNKERMHPSHSPPTSDLQSGVDFIATNQHKGSTQVSSAPMNRGIAQSDSSYDSNHTVNHRISSYEANFQQGVSSSMDVRSNSRDAGYFNLPSKADEIVPRSLHSSETSGGPRASESVLNSREVKHAASYPNELGPGMPSSSIGASSYDDLPIENHSNNSIFPMSSGAHPPEDPPKKLGVSDEAKIEPWSNKIAFQLCPMYGSPEPSTLNRLFVGNLAPSIDDAALYQLFSQFGRVLEARVLRDGGDGRSRGIGVVAMSIVEESRAACRALDGRYVEGCPLRINAVAFKH